MSCQSCDPSGRASLERAEGKRFIYHDDDAPAPGSFARTRRSSTCSTATTVSSAVCDGGLSSPTSSLPNANPGQNMRAFLLFARDIGRKTAIDSIQWQTARLTIEGKPAGDRESIGRKIVQENKTLSVGDPAPDFELTDADGTRHRLSSFRGRRVVLSFHRFGACPLCAYNIDRMRTQYKIFKQAGIVTICVYQSTPRNVAKYAADVVHDGKLLALADEGGAVYREYMLGERSAPAGFAPDKVFRKAVKRIHNVKRQRDQNRVPVDGKPIPGDFLIDEDGRVVDWVKGGVIPTERIEAFIPREKRCRCNRRDCVWPRCRAEHEAIMAESVIYAG